MATIDVPCIGIKQGDRDLLVAGITAGVVAQISYVAVRGQTDESGAVQRVLNGRRINSIKGFTLNGGAYPGAIVLNWTNDDNPIERVNGTIRFQDDPRSAQIIDGQHRVAGIAAAIVENPDFSNLVLSVAIYDHLTTQECADIFLSINTEQKTVPRSLVFDLYGIASEGTIDPAAVRARDIAVILNESDESAYQKNIKFPGTPMRKGGIALSTAVTAIKPLVEESGTFEQVGITEFELQQQIVLNYFDALRNQYGDAWNDRSNAFQYAAGFIGSIEFLQTRIIPICFQKRNFTSETMEQMIDLSKSGLILQAEVKGLGGKDAPKRIFERLLDSLATEGDLSSQIVV